MQRGKVVRLPGQELNMAASQRPAKPKEESKGLPPVPRRRKKRTAQRKADLRKKLNFQAYRRLKHTAQ